MKNFNEPLNQTLRVLAATASSQIYQDVRKTQDGFSYGLYTAEIDNSKVLFVAFRGTVELKDLLHDYNIARGKVSDSMKLAAESARKIKEEFEDKYDDIYFVGHSKGASEALYAGVSVESKVIGFECPRFILPEKFDKKTAQENVCIYRTKGSSISKWGIPTEVEKDFEIVTVELLKDKKQEIGTRASILDACKNIQGKKTANKMLVNVAKAHAWIQKERLTHQIENFTTFNSEDTLKSIEKDSATLPAEYRDEIIKNIELDTKENKSRIEFLETIERNPLDINKNYDKKPKYIKNIEAIIPKLQKHAIEIGLLAYLEVDCAKEIGKEYQQKANSIVTKAKNELEEYQSYKFNSINRGDVYYQKIWSVCIANDISTQREQLEFNQRCRNILKDNLQQATNIENIQQNITDNDEKIIDKLEQLASNIRKVTKGGYINAFARTVGVLAGKKMGLITGGAIGLISSLSNPKEKKLKAINSYNELHKKNMGSLECLDELADRLTTGRKTILKNLQKMPEKIEPDLMMRMLLECKKDVDKHYKKTSDEKEIAQKESLYHEEKEKKDRKRSEDTKRSKRSRKNNDKRANEHEVEKNRQKAILAQKTIEESALKKQKEQLAVDLLIQTEFASAFKAIYDSFHSMTRESNSQLAQFYKEKIKEKNITEGDFYETMNNFFASSCDHGFSGEGTQLSRENIRAHYLEKVKKWLGDDNITDDEIGKLFDDELKTKGNFIIEKYIALGTLNLERQWESTDRLYFGMQRGVSEVLSELKTSGLHRNLGITDKQLLIAQKSSEIAVASYQIFQNGRGIYYQLRPLLSLLNSAAEGGLQVGVGAITGNVISTSLGLINIAGLGLKIYNLATGKKNETEIEKLTASIDNLRKDIRGGFENLNCEIKDLKNLLEKNDANLQELDAKISQLCSSSDIPNLSKKLDLKHQADFKHQLTQQQFKISCKITEIFGSLEDEKYRIAKEQLKNLIQIMDGFNYTPRLENPSREAYGLIAAQPWNHINSLKQKDNNKKYGHIQLVADVYIGILRLQDLFSNEQNKYFNEFKKTLKKHEKSIKLKLKLLLKFIEISRELKWLPSTLSSMHDSLMNLQSRSKPLIKDHNDAVNTNFKNATKKSFTADEYPALDLESEEFRWFYKTSARYQINASSTYPIESKGSTFYDQYRATILKIKDYTPEQLVKANILRDESRGVYYSDLYSNCFVIEPVLDARKVMLPILFPKEVINYIQKNYTEIKELYKKQKNNECLVKPEYSFTESEYEEDIIELKFHFKYIDVDGKSCDFPHKDIPILRISKSLLGDTGYRALYTKGNLSYISDKELFKLLFKIMYGIDYIYNTAGLLHSNSVLDKFFGMHPFVVAVNIYNHYNRDYSIESGFIYGKDNTRLGQLNKVYRRIFFPSFFKVFKLLPHAEEASCILINSATLPTGTKYVRNGMDWGGENLHFLRALHSESESSARDKILQSESESESESELSVKDKILQSYTGSEKFNNSYFINKFFHKINYAEPESIEENSRENLNQISLRYQISLGKKLSFLLKDNNFNDIFATYKNNYEKFMAFMKLLSNRSYKENVRMFSINNDKDIFIAHPIHVLEIVTKKPWLLEFIIKPFNDKNSLLELVGGELSEYNKNNAHYSLNRLVDPKMPPEVKVAEWSYKSFNPDPSVQKTLTWLEKSTTDLSELVTSHGTDQRIKSPCPRI